VLVGGPHERRLLKYLFIEQQHDPLERPAQNDSETVPVHIQFSLIKLMGCVSDIELSYCPHFSLSGDEQDVKSNLLTSNLWVTQVRIFID
jgi:hypothetical protein